MYSYLNPIKRAEIFSIAMLLTGLLISPPAFSQSGQPSLPMLTTPSPEATAMNRYGNYPVSLYTGLVDITIPIFEININGIKVPIEFKYHASGLKYDDVPMELGYGWTLMAGGTVSHSVRGTPNGRSFSGSGQQANPYFWVKDISDIQRYVNTRAGMPENDQTRLFYINNGIRYPYPNNNETNSEYYADSEYDLYEYNFLNHTGQTYFGDGNTIKVPANGLNAVMQGLLGVVTDNDGITYNFTQMDFDEWGFNEVWYLTKITSANKADAVTFDYTTLTRTSANAIKKPVIDQWFEWKTISNYNGAISIDYGHKGSGKTYKYYYPPRLNSITYRGGRIDFIYANTTSRNLSEIKIYDNRNVLFRTIKLIKPRTDWLDGIEFRDNAGAVQQTYGFEYNGTPDTSSGIDYWGYYNGSPLGAGYNSYIPNFTFSYYDNGKNYSYTIPGISRDPYLFYMQKGILTKIVYPTKGYTVFEYEAHKANNVIYGGLRIKEIRNYNHDNALVERKWYKYGTGESGNGRSAVASYTNPVNYIGDFYRETFLAENGFCTAVETPFPSYVFDRLGNTYYTKTFYPFPLTSYFVSGSTVVYPEVAEYSGTGSVANGKTVYKYTDTPDETYSRTFRGASQPQKYKTWYWKNGLLLNKEVFNSSNQMIYSLSNSYSYLLTSETLNLGSMQYADLVDIPDPYGFRKYDAEQIKNNLNEMYSMNFASLIDGTLFDYYNYYITKGMPVMTSSTEYSDGVITTTTYSGYNDIGLPGQMQVTKSNGDNQITKYKYPTDLSATAPYNSMVANNILTPVIQQEQYKGATFLSKSVNEYKNWGNNRFEPEIMKFQPTTSSPLENRIIYYNRDSYGNPLYISKDNADQVVYLWSYNYQYPIAKIEGATYADVKAALGNYTDTQVETLAAQSDPNVSLIDTNLRTYFKDRTALVTTYTYKSLVGILTMTDPRGVVTKYDYDNFGRLIKVTQADKVIEAYEYHYKN